MLPFSLHGYLTSARTSTGASPFSLVYGIKVVLPVKVQIPSLRIMKDAGLNEDDWIQTRLDQLNLIDEKRLTAVFHGQTYQKQMIKAFNKKVRRQVYQVAMSGKHYTTFMTSLGNYYYNVIPFGLKNTGQHTSG